MNKCGGLPLFNWFSVGTWRILHGRLGSGLSPLGVLISVITITIIRPTQIKRNNYHHSIISFCFVICWSQEWPQMFGDNVSSHFGCFICRDMHLSGCEDVLDLCNLDALLSWSIFRKPYDLTWPIQLSDQSNGKFSLFPKSIQKKIHNCISSR